MAIDDWAQLMLRRLRAAKAATQFGEELRPTLEAAARAGAMAAQQRRTPARAVIETTPYGLQLRFTGPGAPHARAVAKRALDRTLPGAVEQVRANVSRRLRS